MSLYPNSHYSETCLRRPLEGPSKCGLCYQVVSLSRVILLERASLDSGSRGLVGQVVALSEWSPYPSGRLIRVIALTAFTVDVLQWDVTLLWAWKFCRYSRIVVVSAVVISEVDCTYNETSGIRTFRE